MPAQAPPAVHPQATLALEALGEHLRKRRKALKVAAGTAAAAAGMSRQTLNRIERGEPSVTMGAYVNALGALGLRLEVEALDARTGPARQGVDPVRVADFPQLKQLAWHLHGVNTGLQLSGEEALALYERNWRHVDQAAMGPDERRLLDALVRRHGSGTLLV